MIRVRALAGLVLFVACAGGPTKKEGPPRADVQALERETLVQAKRARLVVSDHWKKTARLEGVHVDRSDPAAIVARGKAVFRLENLRVEAEEIRVRWLADHQDFLLYAEEVALFHQKRAQPYHSQNLAAVTMANDQVSFFQQ